MMKLACILSLSLLCGCSAWKVQAEAYDRSTDVQDSAVENLRATALQYLFRLTSAKIQAAASDPDRERLLSKLPRSAAKAMSGSDIETIRQALVETYITRMQRAVLRMGDGPDGIEDWYVDHVRAGALMDATALRAILKQRGIWTNIEAAMQEYGWGEDVVQPSGAEQIGEQDSPSSAAFIPRSMETDWMSDRKPLKASYADAELQRTLEAGRRNRTRLTAAELQME